MIIMVSGLPGSGKSYFATRLADKLRGAYISSDLLRNQFIKSKSYSENEKARVYELMLEELEKRLNNNKHIVLDASFYKSAIRNEFYQLAYTMGRQLKIIEVIADEDTIRQRVSRAREHSDADFNVYLKIKSEFEPIKHEHLILNSSEIGIMIQTAIQYLQPDDEQ